MPWLFASPVLVLGWPPGQACIVRPYKTEVVSLKGVKVLTHSRCRDSNQLSLFSL